MDSKHCVSEQYGEIEYSITELTDYAPPPATILEPIISDNLPELLTNQPANSSFETHSESEQSRPEKNYNPSSPDRSTIIKRKSLRNKKQKTLAYMDYLSEDEAFLAEVYGSDDSDLWEGESDSSSSSGFEGMKKQKKKKWKSSR